MGRQADHLQELTPRTNAQREYDARATASLLGDDDNQPVTPMLAWWQNQATSTWYAETPLGTYLVTLEEPQIWKDSTPVWTVTGRDGERLGWRHTPDCAKAVAEANAQPPGPAHGEPDDLGPAHDPDGPV